MKPGTTEESDSQTHHCDNENGAISYYTTGFYCLSQLNKIISFIS